MRPAHDTRTRDSLGQLPTGLPAMWGLAARAQSQSTPGASALVAPPSNCLDVHTDDPLADEVLAILEATVLLGGFAGLVTGLYLLATNPLPGVTVILASMALLLSSAAKLGEAQEGLHESGSGCGRFSRSRAESSDRQVPGEGCSERWS